DPDLGEDEAGYHTEAPGLHRSRLSGRSVCGAADLRVHGMARVADQLGDRAAAVTYGDRSVRAHGDDPDSADQLCRPGCDTEFVRAGGRGGYGGMLLQYDRICRGELAGE